MPSIETWLAGLGLEKYTGAFESAEIDYETLPDLVEDDLKELGLPLGPRRKIWSAITRMAEAGATRKQPLSAPPAPSDAPAERRHLTVMFIDLVGSTALSARLDAEDMRRLIAGFQSESANVVKEFGGFVAQFLGDGLMCYFGWPHASEDDTERAVRAGLRIIDVIGAMTAPDGQRMAVRIGVSSGVVIVGDLMMGGDAQQAAAVGETTNRAARLQGIAPVGRLVISSESIPLLRGRFELTSLGAQSLKGLSSEVEAFLVERETTAESRFSAGGGAALTPIVGRDREINELLRRWSLTRSGQGQMVLVRGEAGIGKSRLIQTLSDALSTEVCSRATLQCSPFHIDSAFYPIVRQLRIAARFSEGDTNEQKLDKLEGVIKQDNSERALMARLLGLDGAARFGEIDAPPAQQRAETMRAILADIEERAADAPLLVLFEDLHWIDPTSLELLEMLLERIRDKPIMVLATTRPTFDHVFSASCPSVELSLTRLDQKRTRDIVAKMTAGKSLPEEIMTIIAQRTDGVPLFVEELTKAVLESGVLDEGGDGYRLTGSVRDIAIPATLHDSLTARLDRLGPIKEIAQIAACIGREFSHRLLSEVCETQPRKLEAALDQLIAADLIRKRRNTLHTAYVFKHALVRDAAYDGLLKERRSDYHRRILAALEAGDGAAPELLAVHAEAAGLTGRAIDHWGAAGAAAIARPAYREAETHLRKAIALNAPGVEAGDAQAIDKAVALHMQLFVAQSPGVGFWADETVATLETARALADKLDDCPHRGDIVYGLLLSTYFRGSLESSLARAEEFTALAESTGDWAQKLSARRLTGNVKLAMGRFEDARPCFDEAEALAAPEADEDLAARLGHDPIVAVRIYQAFCAAFQGDVARASRHRREAVQRAARIGHTNTSAAMLGIALACSHVSGDREAERRDLGSLRSLIDAHAVTASHLWAEVAQAMLGLADGDATALSAYRSAETAMLAANIRFLVPGNRVLTAQRVLKLGMRDEAAELAAGAATLMAETGENSWLAERHRLSATLATLEGDHDEAERHLKAAIRIGAESGGLLWECRAALDLAALYRDAGDRARATAALNGLLNDRPDGFCPVEVEAARRMMAELERQ